MMYEPWTRILAPPERPPDAPRVSRIATRALALVVAVAVAVVVVDSASGARPRPITLEGPSQLDRVQAVDNARAGESAGDVLVFTERLLDKRARPIGSDGDRFTFGIRLAR
jgi:hypothetical protein